MEDIKAVIRSFVADSILFSSTGFPYEDDASFLENGIVDSINIMEIVNFVEKRYGIAVGDDDIVPDNFDSIDSMAAFVVRKKAKVAE